MQTEFTGAVGKRASDLNLAYKQLADAFYTLENIQKAWPHEIDDYIREDVDECTPIKEELLAVLKQLAMAKLQVSNLAVDVNGLAIDLMRVGSAE